MRARWISWLLCTALLAAWQGMVLAQEVAAPDARAVQRVIRAQLDAFASDDADKAFSYASPDIRRLFRTADNFLAMVRNGYAVVYRPASVVFLKPGRDGDQIVQPVQMTDGAGLVWIALYSMQRQDGGAWLTNGCRLGRSEGRVT